MPAPCFSHTSSSACASASTATLPGGGGRWSNSQRSSMRWRQSSAESPTHRAGRVRIQPMIAFSHSIGTIVRRSKRPWMWSSSVSCGLIKIGDASGE